MKSRMVWDEYFLKMAELISNRSTCDRLNVGCVLVKDRDIISTGYNGSVMGEPHCDDSGHDLEDGHCVRTVHAEMNAICMAARNGHQTKNSTIYTTHFPCWLCFKLLVQSGISKVVYRQDYRNSQRVIDTAASKNIEIVKL